MGGEIGADVLGTAVNQDNGAISAQIGDAVAGEVLCDNAEWWQQVGFASRPGAATPGKPSCQVLSLETVDRDVCYASRDLRSGQVQAGLGLGESCMYAGGPHGTGTARVLAKGTDNDGAVEIRVQKGNADGGADVLIRVASDGNVRVEAEQSASITLVVGQATVTVDASGAAVTKTGATAQEVALYDPMKPYLEAVKNALVAIIGDPSATPPVPGVAAILAPFPGGAAVAANMLASLVMVKAAALQALSKTTAASAILRAATQ